MAKRKRWKKILLGLLLALVLVLTIGLPFALARLVTRAGTRPMDLKLTSTPADYDLDYESVVFTSTDGVELSGWYMGGADSELVVACGHGLFRSRREVLDRAAFFRKQGFDTLVFDFRRHGESAGERVTLGYHERNDFGSAARFLRERRPDAKVLLYGVSMGAVAALLAASELTEVDAVVADSPFLNIEHTVMHHLDLLFGLPRFPFGSSLLLAIELSAGFDRDDFDLEKAIARMGERPVLIVAGEEDRRMSVALQERVFKASVSEASRFRSFPDARHGAAYRMHADAYEAMLMDFVEDAIRSPELPEASDVDSNPGSPSSSCAPRCDRLGWDGRDSAAGRRHGSCRNPRTGNSAG